MPELSFVSLYSGCGGLDLGFRQAGFRPIWANDIDADAVETYNGFAQLIEDGHRATHGDIRAQALPSKGAADLVVGGPPCQGFSVAGNMDPDDPRSKHVWDFLGVVKTIQPAGFVMENVKALAVNRRWGALRQALVEEAERMGYRTRLLLVNASHFGVPQARERMFLIGLRDATEIRLTPTSASSPPTVREALESLPRFGDRGNDSICTARITPAKNPVLRKSPFAGMLFNGQGRPLALDRPALTLPASMGGNRTPIVDQQELESGGECWVIGYHKHLMGGGKPYKSIPGRMRRLTVEEAAAIQTFPAGAEFAGPQSAQYRQIGNAVPPTLAFHVASAVRRSLVGDPLPELGPTSEANASNRPPSVVDMTPETVAVG